MTRETLDEQAAQIRALAKGLTPENCYPFTPERVAAANAWLHQLEDRWALYRTPTVEVAPAAPSPKVPAADAVYDPVRCVWSDGTTDEQFYRVTP